MTKVSTDDLEKAIQALGTHVLGDLCETADVAAIERVREWLESEKLYRDIKAVARESGQPVAAVRAAIKQAM